MQWSSFINILEQKQNDKFYCQINLYCLKIRCIAVTMSI